MLAHHPDRYGPADATDVLTDASLPCCISLGDDLSVFNWYMATMHGN